MKKWAWNLVKEMKMKGMSTRLEYRVKSANGLIGQLIKMGSFVCLLYCSIKFQNMF